MGVAAGAYTGAAAAPIGGIGVAGAGGATAASGAATAAEADDERDVATEAANGLTSQSASFMKAAAFAAASTIA